MGLFLMSEVSLYPAPPPMLEPKYRHQDERISSPEWLAKRANTLVDCAVAAALADIFSPSPDADADRA